MFSDTEMTVLKVGAILLYAGVTIWLLWFLVKIFADIAERRERRGRDDR